MVLRHVLTGAAFTLAASTAAAAEPVADDRWLPFQGCWRAAEAPAGNLLCVVAEGDNVRLVELANGAITRETRMLSDGRENPIAQEGCTGTERTHWSANSRRLYLSTQLTCGTQIARNSSGLFALISPTTWVSINAIAVNDEAAIRTIRYELVESPANLPEAISASLSANRLAREVARLNASAPLELADVVEAGQQVHGRAVEALLMTRGQVFELNGAKLLTLVDAGVPSYLVDAVVAVSNPQRFAVRDAKPVEVEEVTARSGRYDRYCDELDSWYSRDCRYSRYSPFGYYSPYDHGYGYYGYRSNPVIVIVQPDDDDTPAPRHGRATRRGYTNGRSEETRTVADRSPDSQRSGTSTTTTSSSGSSTSKSGGSSSTGSDDRGKAKPRTSGGN